LSNYTKSTNFATKDALASGNAELINTFENTLNTLALNQHKNGTIPSNVLVNDNGSKVSYGGLAGRVDAVTWFVIGICQFAFYKNDSSFIFKYESQIQKCLSAFRSLGI